MAQNEVIEGVVSDPSVRTTGEIRPLPICKDTDSVRVCFASPLPNPPPFGSWKGSGEIVGAAGAVVGFAADVPNALAVNPVRYPRGVATPSVQLSLFITDNQFVATTTRFEIYLNAAATGQFIDVPANGGVGNGLIQQTFLLAFANGDTFDLRVSNPGGVAEVGKVLSFGYGAEFF